MRLQAVKTGVKIGVVVAFAGISWVMWTGKDAWVIRGRM